MASSETQQQAPTEQQRSQLQRMVNKLIERCPKDWEIAQQQIIIEDQQAELESLRQQAAAPEAGD